MATRCLDSHIVLATDLRFPEGPIAQSDDSVIFVELAGGTIRKIASDGSRTVIASPGGGPNGAAIGPDGSIYVCNNGGFAWGKPDPYLQPKGYTGGWIEKIDPLTGDTKVLYRACGSEMLHAPNDLVFDVHGGFYFTDSGKKRERDQDYGAVFYAAANGEEILKVASPMMSPNGIGLSPDGKQLYVAETETARLWAFDLVAPGQISRHDLVEHGGRLVVGLGGYQKFDGLAVDAYGNICIATMVIGAITMVASDGHVITQISVPDPEVTNICFGGPDRRSAYITCGGIGHLIEARWPTAGLKLAFGM